ncbi:hypothetical protein OIU84_000156 [Salix udensis]|uniref:WRKY domain-containing protein n=1 Tax=Salix udensis TaxID=889485 RepID=A0AAD6L5K8_9ROSI|nr:hypothetical protein OIU84_000156 [Salix udensis]
MDVFPSYSEKVEALQSELEHRQKENEKLRMKAASNLPEGDRFCHEILASNKRPRSHEVPITRASRILVRSHSNDKSLIVKDGYQWRKYGQKVQRCVEDDSVLVASYDGEHNHEPNGSHGQYLCSANRSSSSKSSISIHGPISPIETPPQPSSIALDLTLSSPDNQHREKPCRRSMEVCEKIDKNNSRKCIEEYVASLTTDPSFSVALAAAVARSMSDLSTSRLL